MPLYLWWLCENGRLRGRGIGVVALLSFYGDVEATLLPESDSGGHEVKTGHRVLPCPLRSANRFYVGVGSGVGGVKGFY